MSLTALVDDERNLLEPPLPGIMGLLDLWPFPYQSSLKYVSNPEGSFVLSLLPTAKRKLLLRRPLELRHCPPGLLLGQPH